MNPLIKELKENQWLEAKKMQWLLENNSSELRKEISHEAREVAHETFGNEIYLRGLIEFSNVCKNDCYYCGIRKGNKKTHRYRLTEDQILDCCEIGENLGFKTFVLQSGEDPYFNEDRVVELIKRIKKRYPENAITLSMGEKSRQSYERFFDAGADRYLLRHETADKEHYGKLHPRELSLWDRMNCLMNLKDIGFQVGTGFMVGSPYQKAEFLVKDLEFIRGLNPQMVGIGPFIPHQDTPFGEEKSGTMEDTLLLISILRLMLPKALLPATTALGTIHPQGREEGILAGANVVMPNLSPVEFRKDYSLYDNKICTGDEAAECRNCLEGRLKSIGYSISNSRGDYKN
ncbi:MAG: [FeFe] hydrogenase H-cluster radical SAM maturase HydE [Eubacteriaceae bacterium]